MVEKFLGYLDDGAEDGIKQSIYYEEQKDRLIIRESQDVSSILAENRARRNDSHGKRFGDWTRIAQVPGIIVNSLMKQGIWQNKRKLRKWLNKTEFKNLRTREGHF